MDERLYAVAVWRDAPYFSETEARRLAQMTDKLQTSHAFRFAQFCCT
jgi:hypothetical protein